MRPHLKMSGASYRLDETYMKVGKGWKYLYRAVEPMGSTIEPMLSAKRDVPAAKRLPVRRDVRAELAVVDGLGLLELRIGSRRG